MPVAIAGMHRAGTSMIARMLAACGLDLGPVDQHLPPQPDNPEGFFEHRAFVDLNERLLAALGGIWRDPPQPAPGWEHGPALDQLANEASTIPSEFGLREPWGWKDPRNSITLPFWRRLYPDLAIVICVRHPLETAYSLLERDHLPIQSGLELWTAYYRQAVADAPVERRIVVHYAAFFDRPQQELRRLVDALGIPASDDTILGATANVAAKMRHSRLGLRALTALRAGSHVNALYDELCRDANFRPAECEETSSGTETLSDAVVRLERSLDGCVRKYWQELQGRHEIRALKAKIENLEAMVAGQRAFIDEREKYIGALQEHLAVLGARVDCLEDRLSARRHRYADAVANAARRVLQPFRG